MFPQTLHIPVDGFQRNDEAIKSLRAEKRSGISTTSTPGAVEDSSLSMSSSQTANSHDSWLRRRLPLDSLGGVINLSLLADDRNNLQHSHALDERTKMKRPSTTIESRKKKPVWQYTIEELAAPAT